MLFPLMYFGYPQTSLTSAIIFALITNNWKSHRAILNIIDVLYLRKMYHYGQFLHLVIEVGFNFSIWKYYYVDLRL